PPEIVALVLPTLCIHLIRCCVDQVSAEVAEDSNPVTYASKWPPGTITGCLGSRARPKASIARSVGVSVSFCATIIMNGVGEIRWTSAAGLYSRASSNERTVCSFFHLGARVLPVWVNQSWASCVGSAAAWRC